MKEVVILILVAFSSIFILGYSLHMLIGGLVNEEMETWIITTACGIGVVVVCFMAWDIMKQRRLR
jgi:Mn2+/Fe2+ NRAMP family transporter